MAKKPPATRFRIGSLTASVWENTSVEGRTFYMVDLSRGYQDDGKWRDTHQLRHQDLLNATGLLQRAEGWIAEQELLAADQPAEAAA